MSGKIVGVRGGGHNNTGVKGVHYGGNYLSEKELEAVIAGTDAVGGKAKVQYDLCPFDESGEEVKPGDPRLADGFCEGFVEQNQELVDNFAQTGDESNTGLKRADGTKDDDHGCTPVAHIASSIEGRDQFRTRHYWKDRASGQQVGEEFFTPYITVA